MQRKVLFNAINRWAIFSVSVDLHYVAPGMMAWWRFEMYNLMLLTSSLLSLIFYSNKRCLFDFNNLTWLIRRPRSGFLFEARGWTFCPVIWHSMSANFMPIFEGFLNFFSIITIFSLASVSSRTHNWQQVFCRILYTNGGALCQEFLAKAVETGTKNRCMIKATHVWKDKI